MVKWLFILRMRWFWCVVTWLQCITSLYCERILFSKAHPVEKAHPFEWTLEGPWVLSPVIKPLAWDVNDRCCFFGSSYSPSSGAVVVTTAPRTTVEIASIVLPSACLFQNTWITTDTNHHKNTELQSTPGLSRYRSYYFLIGDLHKFTSYNFDTVASSVTALF